DGYGPGGGSGRGPDGAAGGGPAARPAGHRRRRPVAIVLAAAVLVAVVCTVAFGTGLLGGDGGDGGDRADGTSPDGQQTTSEALPTWDGKMTDSPKPTPGGSSSASPSASPSTSPSGGASASPSASSSPSSEEPSASPSPTAAQSSDAAPEPTDEPDDRPTSAPPPPDPTDDPPRPTGPPVLRQGDSGPEVAELQDRLRQTWTYGGSADGDYDTGVANAVGAYQRRHHLTGDPEGVYGPHTRSYLEARTDKP
ncbi:peptidoglycan-binding domain-containing protein, partial [Streptomyces sp. HSW2009]|uniref:peptidoglycan-binding domain-containing protein n=1 Tax=Streptomyces sp. HSW2009 TaxID=3142890 RepID=UPI0032EC122E